VFLVLFVVALALQAAIVWPIIAVEEGPGEALHVFGRAWGRLDPTDESNGGVAFELVLIAAAIAGTQVAFVAPLMPGLFGRMVRADEGRSLRASVIAAIVIALFLSGGTLLIVLQLVLLVAAGPLGSASLDDLGLIGGENAVGTVLVLVWLAMGVGWTVALWSIGRSRDPRVLARWSRWILAGTGLELALSIPRGETRTATARSRRSGPFSSARQRCSGCAARVPFSFSRATSAVDGRAAPA
jgi:hypothetical protein